MRKIELGAEREEYRERETGSRERVEEIIGEIRGEGGRLRQILGGCTKVSIV